MKCWKCGMELEEDSMFCDNCGAKVTAEGREESNETVVVNAFPDEAGKDPGAEIAGEASRPGAGGSGPGAADSPGTDGGSDTEGAIGRNPEPGGAGIIRHVTDGCGGPGAMGLLPQLRRQVRRGRGVLR